MEMLYRFLGRLAVRLRIVNPRLEPWLLDGLDNMDARHRKQWQSRYAEEGHATPIVDLVQSVETDFPQSKLARCFGWRLVGVCENVDGVTLRIVIQQRSVRFKYDVWCYDIEPWLARCNAIKGVYNAELDWLLDNARKTS